MLSARLRSARKMKNLSQEKLAELVGTTKATISNYENQYNSPPTEMLVKLADVLDVTTDWLLGRFSSTQRGFGRDHVNKATKKYLDLRMLYTPEDLPEKLPWELQPPVLLYQVLQLRDGVPLSISHSYLPNSLPLNKLQKILEGVKQNPALSLYRTLESFGRKPITCKEVLTVDKASNEEVKLLEMPEDVPVARIIRKTFDASSKLVEYCLLTSRTDLYKFTYKFTL